MFYTQYELERQELAMVPLDGFESIEFPVRQVTTEGVTSAAIRIQDCIDMCLGKAWVTAWLLALGLALLPA